MNNAFTTRASGSLIEMLIFDLHSIWGYAAVSTVRLRSEPETGETGKLAAATELFRRVEPKPREINPAGTSGRFPKPKQIVFGRCTQDSVRASTQQEGAECVASINRTMKAIQNQDGERLFDDVQCLGPPPGGICQTSSRVWTGSRLLPRWQESRTGFVGWFRIWTAWKTGQFSLRLGMSWNDSDWRGGNIGEKGELRSRSSRTGPVELPTVLPVR
jgi:hypothetical protein